MWNVRIKAFWYTKNIQFAKSVKSILVGALLLTIIGGGGGKGSKYGRRSPENGWKTGGGRTSLLDGTLCGK